MNTMKIPSKLEKNHNILILSHHRNLITSPKMLLRGKTTCVNHLFNCYICKNTFIEIGFDIHQVI